MLDTLLTQLASRADAVADVSILQDADPFLESAGEDMRRRIFITENASGALQCLRPEFTIPICLQHAAQGGRYAYGGTVFRQGREGGAEFQQVGLEDLGANDTIEADARAIVDLVEALAKVGVDAPHITLGDQAVFERVVASLEIPTRHAQRLSRSFGDKAALQRAFEDLRNPQPLGGLSEEAKRLAAADNVDALEEFVSEQMAQANLSARSGRSARAIAQRTIERVQDSAFALNDHQADALAAFLSAEVNLHQGVEALNHRARDYGLDLGDTLDAFDQRAKLLADLPKDVTVGYNAALGSKLDYYTGVVFEARVFGSETAIAGGGRYDRLCTLLGSPTSVPAVGFSITLDRLSEAAA